MYTNHIKIEVNNEHVEGTWSYRLNTNIAMACHHIDFKTYAVIQGIHNHDNHHLQVWHMIT